MSNSLETRIHEWTIDNRFSIVLVFLIFVVLLGIGVLVGYFYEWLTSSQVRIAVSGVGAFGTLSLAIFTVLSVLETQKQAQERVKEQDRYIQERILQEVNDLLDTVDENEMKLYDPEFDWSTAVEVSDDDKAIFVNLDTLGIDHPTIGGRFNEEYPSAQESIDEYNNLLCDVDRDAALIVEESSDYIEECIESFNITNEEGGFIDSKEALNLVLSGEIIYRERTNEDHPDWWRMEDELKKQVDTCVTDDLQEFFNEKQQVKIKSSVVRDELNDVREYILEEYPVQPQN